MPDVSVNRKTVGVLGGMGPAATVDFFRRIVESTTVQRDQEHVHVIIDNLPQVPDRTGFLLHGGEDPGPVLIEMARRLEAAGADFLVMPCNTASAFTALIQDAVAIPVIDWAAETAKGVVTGTSGAKRVGLLATRGTIEAGIYHRTFEDLGVQILTPPEPHQEQVMNAIYGPRGVKAGHADLACARIEVDAAGQALVDAGADAVLLACTELSVLFAAHEPRWSAPTFDASQIVAEHVIARAGGDVGTGNVGRTRSVGATTGR
jgi:aspartate racemase